MSPSRSFIATSEYRVIDRAPLLLVEGDCVRVGAPDPDWPGWTWVTAITGRGSYVPDSHIELRGDGTAVVLKDFHARDLSVVKNEKINSLREVQGWHWCRNANDEEGWLPAYLLKSCPPG